MNIVLVVKNDATSRKIDTGIKAMVAKGEILVPFKDDAAAWDCLRLVLRMVGRIDAWEQFAPEQEES
jgi:hypothetical protein